MAPRARANQSYTWAQVKSVQSLIERCLNQYMTQAEIIATLQVQADVEPALTCLVWSKLEEQNPDFFLSYDIQLRLKDQIARPRVPLRARRRFASCRGGARSPAASRRSRRPPSPRTRRTRRASAGACAPWGPESLDIGGAGHPWGGARRCDAADRDCVTDGGDGAAATVAPPPGLGDRTLAGVATLKISVAGRDEGALRVGLFDSSGAREVAYRKRFGLRKTPEEFQPARAPKIADDGGAAPKLPPGAPTGAAAARLEFGLAVAEVDGRNRVPVGVLLDDESMALLAYLGAGPSCRSARSAARPASHRQGRRRGERRNV
ncbi:3',5'-cyclic-nucleotide phosphodiesterase [Aureococcus anophagefferens]|nr:3',5'-cyclic-nucleotide phosphodiesterase [Aureococcus anophagefferens]